MAARAVVLGSPAGLAGGLLRPALIDAILVLLAIETLWLAWRTRRSGNDAPSLRFALSFAMAGAGLLVAVRAVLAGWPPEVALVALAAAGVGNALHVAHAFTRRH